jgi:hypothetical protein
MAQRIFSIFSITYMKAGFDINQIFSSLRRYHYFEVVLGLALSYDPESYVGGSVATGSVLSYPSRLHTQFR